MGSDDRKGGVVQNMQFGFGGEIFKKANFHISTLLSEFHEAFGYDLPKTVFASGTLQ